MNTRLDKRAVASNALVFWAVAALLVSIAVVVDVAAQALLLTFAGILFGTALRGVSLLLSSKLGWSMSWSLIACLVTLTLLLLGVGVWIVPSIADQFSALTDQVMHGYETARRNLMQSELGNRLLGSSENLGSEFASYAKRAAGLLTSVIGALGSLLFVVFVALYLAVNPRPYRHGVLQLAPPAHRERAAEVLDALASTLRRWLLGRMVSMLAVGLSTGVAMAILGIPLPVTLGLTAGLLGFVPTIGPFVSAIPAVLLAFTQSPLSALYVAIAYLAINLGDGYGLTPWLQKKAVSIPPALIIVGQIVLGALWGVLGVMFATPLLACAIVLTRELYVRELRGTNGQERANTE